MDSSQLGGHNNTTSALIPVAKAGRNIIGYTIPRSIVHDMAVAVGVIAIILNLLTIVVFLRRKNLLGWNQRVILINQSVIDFVQSVSIIYAQYYSFHVGSIMPDEVPHTLLYCKLFWSYGFQRGLMFASTLNLVLLTVERYISVCHPVKHKNRCTKKFVYILMGLVWPGGFIFPVWLMVQPIFRLHLDTNICYYDDLVEGQVLVAIVFYLYTLIIPMIVITFCYVRMFVLLKTRVFAASGDEKDKLKKSRNFVIVCSIIGAAYIFCFIWGPTHYFLFAVKLIRHDPIMQVFGALMVNANCFVNPIIYFVKMKEFREEIIQIFTLK